MKPKVFHSVALRVGLWTIQFVASILAIFALIPVLAGEGGGLRLFVYCLIAFIASVLHAYEWMRIVNEKAKEGERRQ
ncbi:MAG: hypothetical protein WA766_15015 [Candidatus Acidiferrales bacterium]